MYNIQSVQILLYFTIGFRLLWTSLFDSISKLFIKNTVQERQKLSDNSFVLFEKVGKVIRIQKARKNDKAKSNGVLTSDEQLLWRENKELISSPNNEVLEQRYVKHVIIPLLGPKHVDAGVSFYYYCIWSLYSFKCIMMIFRFSSDANGKLMMFPFSL